MSLFKKTIVLTNNGAKGYVTVVRVGSSAGAKAVLATAPSPNTFVAIKIQNSDLIVAELKEMITEIPLLADISDRTAIGVAVLCEGHIVATGGKKDMVDLPHAASLIAAKVAPAPPPVAQNLQNQEQNCADTIEEPPSANSDEAVDVTDNVQVEPPPSFADSVAETVLNNADATPKPRNFDFLKNKRPHYYASVQERVEEILRVYPAESALCDLIPDSEWVMVHYDARDYYVFGVLRDGKRVTHIGYGLPGFEGVAPPKEAVDIADFVPLQNPPQQGMGYWLMFQSADDGKLIK